MTAPSYRHATGSQTQTAKADPLSCAKPTGLSEGDLLVFASLAYAKHIGSPSGFTERASVNGDGYTPYGKLFTKVADASDVATSAFTIANTTKTEAWAALYAIADYGSIKYADAAMTPHDDFPFADCKVNGYEASDGDLLVAVFMAYAGVNKTVACANNNPVWTYDLSDYTFAYYHSGHATYGADAATGAITIDGGFGPGYNDGTLLVLAVGTPSALCDPRLYLDGGVMDEPAMDMF